MVVVWTEASVESKWVLIETTKGEKRGGLVPVKLDDVEVPLQFSLLQAANLTEWDGSTSHPELLATVSALEEILGIPAPAAEPVAAQEDAQDEEETARPDEDAETLDGALGGGADAQPNGRPEDGPTPPPGADDPLNRSIWIEGGTLNMGSDLKDNESPIHRVTISGFWMQEHPVTNLEYGQFASQHSYEIVKKSHPVTKVSWDEAMEYAQFRGGSLPTEAQWEFAARGTEGRLYPWGDEPPTCLRAHSVDCPPGTIEVKSLSAGATPESIYDLAGNVWEWVADWYRPYEPVGSRPQARWQLSSKHLYKSSE